MLGYVAESHFLPDSVDELLADAEEHLAKTWEDINLTHIQAKYQSISFEVYDEHIVFEANLVRFKFYLWISVSFLILFLSIINLLSTTFDVFYLKWYYERLIEPFFIEDFNSSYMMRQLNNSF